MLLWLYKDDSWEAMTQSSILNLGPKPKLTPSTARLFLPGSAQVEALFFLPGPGPKATGKEP